MAHDHRFRRHDLEAFVRQVLEYFGVPAADAAIAAARIIDADARLVESHGITRLPAYARRLREGGYNIRPVIGVVHETPVSALLDGDNGLGQVIMTKATELAIEKALASGIGWVGVRGSNHAGAGGVYASMVSEQRLIGMYMAIGNANHLPPWGGREPLMSTNPIAFAIPSGQRPDLVFDMATTAVSYGRIKLAAQRGESMPEGWMVDQDGQPLTDPTRSSEGLLLPTGGYKGYGLGLVVGALAGVLNGAAVGSATVDFNADFKTPTNTGHLIVAIRPDLFGPVQDFEVRMESWLRELTGSERLPDVDRIRVPGDQIPDRLDAAEHDGVRVGAANLVLLNELARETGAEFPAPLA